MITKTIKQESHLGYKGYQLDIFNRFKSIPKVTSDDEEPMEGGSDSIVSRPSRSVIEFTTNSPQIFTSEDAAFLRDSWMDKISPHDLDMDVVYQYKNRTFLKRLLNLFTNPFKNIVKNKKDKLEKQKAVEKTIVKITRMNIDKFFESVKKVLEQDGMLTDANEQIISSLKTAIVSAREMNQTALMESIQNRLVVTLKEILIVTKFPKFIEESDLLKILISVDEEEKLTLNEIHQNKDHLPLRLTWIGNFTRTIPKEIRELKLMADKLNAFDNYVILHYDPSGESVRSTEQEINKAKDPILFGVIHNSRRLYYIGDWVDEYCNLTLEKLISEYSLIASELSAKTVVSS